ncbi:MAG: glycosyltransferase [Puniceicoccaceae bacterium]|nr:MAG: glycosyltransferase [Puniceicoccaceae bacterium]
MRLALLQDHLRAGGTERQSLYAAHALRSFGWQTRLITFRPGGPLLPLAQRSGIELQSLQRWDWHIDGFAPGLLPALLSFNPDAVLLMGRLANARGPRLQRALPATAIVPTYRTGRLNLPAGFRKVLTTAPLVLTNSAAGADRLRRLYSVSMDRIRLVANACLLGGDDAAAGPDPAALRHRHGAGADSLVLLTVAAFRSEKNHRALLEVVDRLPPSLDWRLWLLGDGPRRASVQRAARRSRFAARCHFLGFQENPAPFYRAADVVLSVSRSEGLPNFLVEAQTFGKPAAAWEAPGIDEIVCHGSTGLLSPQGNADALCEAIIRLADPELRHAFGKTARLRAETAFDPGARTKDLDAALREAVTLCHSQ